MTHWYPEWKRSNDGWITVPQIYVTGVYNAAQVIIDKQGHNIEMILTEVFDKHQIDFNVFYGGAVDRGNHLIHIHVNASQIRFETYLKFLPKNDNQTLGNIIFEGCKLSLIQSIHEN